MIEKPTSTSYNQQMRVIVTGSRNWTDYDTIEKVLRDLPNNSTIIEGGARGADALARFAAKVLGHQVETHLANWDIYGKAAGPLRNQQMIDSGADLLLAFPLPDSIGTNDCIRRAEAAGIPIQQVLPDQSWALTSP